MIEPDLTFSLSSDEPVVKGRPSIDVLFETAAAVFGEGLVGIILTGANQDGAKGISTIRKCGGLTIAQRPEEALYPTMPRAAIEQGGVQYIWGVQEILQFLMMFSTDIKNAKT